MFRLVIICILLMPSLGLGKAEKNSIGEVLIVKGKVFRVLKKDKTGKRKLMPLEKKSHVFEKDVIKTRGKSFLKVQLTDKTLINVGPNSLFSFKQYLFDSQKKSRVNILRYLKGKFRTKVQMKARPGDQVKVISSKQVALGVRGTEILTNVYSAGGKATNDVALLSGEGELLVGGKKKIIQKGEVFNSNKGLEKIEKLTVKEIEYLKQEKFLENRQNPDGTYKEIERAKNIEQNTKPEASEKKSKKEQDEDDDEWVDCDEDDDDEDCQYDVSDMIQVEVEED